MNYGLFRAINDLSGNRVVDAVMKFAAKYLIVVVFVVVAALCVREVLRRHWRPVIATAAALALTFVVGLLEAAVHAEKRPFQTHHVHQLVSHAAGQSFPSDHATAGFGVALAVTAFLSRRWGMALIPLALLIGFARVYDGIHYPLDIAGGILAAAIGVGAVLAVVRLFPPTARDYRRHRVRVGAR
ncbi:MAG: undecaprenyl-diphosphatase [Frankiaceae bacterium]|nr:undecaprenyl-diphosphatase [Frankiaceae bacterium]